MNTLPLELRSNHAARTGRFRESVSRWVVIALLVTAAVAHIPVTPEHLHEAPYMGVLFIGFTVAALAIALALAAGPSAFKYAFAGTLCIAAVLAYAATRLIAFPQLADDVGMWGEPLGVLSITTEFAAAVICLVKVRRVAPSPA